MAPLFPEWSDLAERASDERERDQDDTEIDRARGGRVPIVTRAMTMGARLPKVPRGK